MSRTSFRPERVDGLEVEAVESSPVRDQAARISPKLRIASRCAEERVSGWEKPNSVQYFKPGRARSGRYGRPQLGQSPPGQRHRPSGPAEERLDDGVGERAEHDRHPDVERRLVEVVARREAPVIHWYSSCSPMSGCWLAWNRPSGRRGIGRCTSRLSGTSALGSMTNWCSSGFTRVPLADTSVQPRQLRHLPDLDLRVVLQTRAWSCPSRPYRSPPSAIRSSRNSFGRLLPLRSTRQVWMSQWVRLPSAA